MWVCVCVCVDNNNAGYANNGSLTVTLLGHFHIPSNSTEGLTNSPNPATSTCMIHRIGSAGLASLQAATKSRSVGSVKFAVLYFATTGIRKFDNPLGGKLCEVNSPVPNTFPVNRSNNCPHTHYHSSSSNKNYLTFHLVQLPSNVIAVIHANIGSEV